MLLDLDFEKGFVWEEDQKGLLVEFEEKGFRVTELEDLEAKGLLEGD